MADCGVDLALQLLRILGDSTGLKISYCIFREPPFRKRLKSDPASILSDAALDFFLELPGKLL